MAPHVTPIERLAERPVGVDPAAIEEEFTRIWQETSRSGYDESTVRLRVLNLIAVGSDDHDAAARFDRVMEVLPRDHPCRGILALMSGEDEAVEAAISAHCIRERPGEPELCAEEVLLRGGREQQRELASAVMAVLVPQIRVATWVMGPEDLQSYLVTELMEASDALLIDSGAGDPRASIAAEVSAEREHDLRVFDLAWARAETWRELTAQLFDGTERLHELSAVREIEMRGFRGRRSSEPMLLAGWFVSRLGLSLADLDGDADTMRATLYDGTRGVSLTVGPAWSPEVMGQLRITTANAHFELQAHEMSRHVHVIERWIGADEQRRTVEQPAIDDAALLKIGLDGGADRRIEREAAIAALALLGG